MIAPRHSIFRDQALKHYIHGRKKDVLPNFSSIPATIFVWALLGSLIATGLVAWLGQVPVYLGGYAIVLGNQVPVHGDASALAYFQPGQLARLSVGQSVKVQPEDSNTQQTGTVAQVLPGATTLAAAFKHYGVNFGDASLAGQQEAVALIALGAGFPVALYTGNPVVVEVNVGSQSLFSALAGAGNS